MTESYDLTGHLVEGMYVGKYPIRGIVIETMLRKSGIYFHTVKTLDSYTVDGYERPPGEWLMLADYELTRKGEKVAMEDKPIRPITIENVVRIRDEESGDTIFIEPDEDGLDTVNIRMVDDTGTVEDRLILFREHAVAMAKEILKLYGG